MFIHPQTIRRQKPTNRLCVFDHFVGLAPKGSRKDSVQHKTPISFEKEVALYIKYKSAIS